MSEWFDSGVAIPAFDGEVVDVKLPSGDVLCSLRYNADLGSLSTLLEEPAEHKIYFAQIVAWRPVSVRQWFYRRWKKRVPAKLEKGGCHGVI